MEYFPKPLVSGLDGKGLPLGPPGGPTGKLARNGGGESLMRAGCGPVSDFASRTGRMPFARQVAKEPLKNRAGGFFRAKRLVFGGECGHRRKGVDCAWSRPCMRITDKLDILMKLMPGITWGTGPWGIFPFKGHGQR